LLLSKGAISDLHILPLANGKWKAFELINFLTIHTNYKVEMVLEVVPNLGLHIIKSGKGAFIFHKSKDSDSSYLSEL
jgi:hypothetical protein